LLKFIKLESLFLQARNQPIDYLQYEEEMYILSHSVPFLITETQVLATLTAYNPVSWQCDSTPHITASGKYVKEGYVANNCLPFGTIVEINGKYYEVQDRMNSRYGCEHFERQKSSVGKIKRLRF